MAPHRSDQTGKRATDHSGETLAGWTLLRLLGTAGGSLYECRHTCGFVAMRELSYLREVAWLGRTSCEACSTDKGRKPAGERTIRVGIVVGGREVLRCDRDGRNKYERFWRLKCLKCGVESTVCEASMHSREFRDSGGCRRCCYRGAPNGGRAHPSLSPDGVRVIDCGVQCFRGGRHQVNGVPVPKGDYRVLLERIN